MKERPILMTPENAQKVHEGEKTQTRRIVKFPHMNPLGQWEATTVGGPDGGKDEHGKTSPESVAIWHTRTGDHVFCPYGQVGDRLWIREAVAYKETDLVAYKGDGSCGAWMGDGAGGRIWIHHGWIQGFSAQNGQYVGLSKYGGKWRPSLHMPRWACRTVVELTKIKVERVQDISEEDAKAEGCIPLPDAEIAARVAGDTPARMEFLALWKSIHGHDAWDRNDYVWVLVFKKLPC